MQKAHSNINWENRPSDKTPIHERNLNRMDVSIDTIDDRVIVLDTTKLDKADAQTFVKSIAFDRQTGTFTITYFNGSFDIIDTLLEKIAVNFGYDIVTQKLSITLDDGTIEYIDLSALITQYEFLDSDTIAFQVQPDGKIKAIVKEGSIEEKHLRPDYLADIKVESAKAELNKNAAAASAKEANEYADLSRSYAVGTNNIVREGDETDNAKNYAQLAKKNADTSDEILKNVEKAGEDAVDKINNAFEVNGPRFVVDFTTGELLYDAENYRYLFQINKANGNLEWGLAV